MHSPAYEASKIIRSSWNSNIYTNIFTPRPFQIELLECVLKRNTIVCLNTEIGKHFLSFMTIRELMIKCDNKKYQPTNQLRLAVLLLNSERLVQEQKEVLQNHMNLDVIACTRSSSSCFTPEDWKNVFHNHQVITITPELLLQVFQLDLNCAKLIDLIIFDECNLVCNENHPYQAVMKTLEENELTPNILGLTSSLLHENTTADHLTSIIDQMEDLLHCKAETATDLIALDRYSLSKPNENMVLCSDKHLLGEFYDSHVSDDIREILMNVLDLFDSCQIREDTKVCVVDWEIDGVEDRLKGDGSLGGDAFNEQNKTTGCSEYCETATKSNALLDLNQMGKDGSGEGQIKSLKTVCEINGVSEKINMCDVKVVSNGHEKGISQALIDEAKCTAKDVCIAHKSLIKEMLLILDVLGPWCIYKAIGLVLRELHKTLFRLDRLTKITLKDSGEEELTEGALLWEKMLLQIVQTKFRRIYTMCHPLMEKNKTVKLKFLTPKVHRLLEVLRDLSPEVAESEKKTSSKSSDRSESDSVSWWQDSDVEDEEEIETTDEKDGENNLENYPSPFTNTLCGIVFVQNKSVAMLLQKVIHDLSKDDKKLKYVNSLYLTSSTDPRVQQCFGIFDMDKSKEEEVVRKFRSHESNLLISSNGLEECAYLPKCNLVFSFDAPLTYRSYTESKNRSRAYTSAYVMLVRMSEENEFREKLQEYKLIEKVLRGPAWFDDDDVMLSSEIEQDIEDYDSIIPTYWASPTACANLQNAIRIVNRYCSRLPSDPFTHLSPHCEIAEEPVGDDYDNEVMYRCTLQLPINSRVREPITGVPMPSVLLAQRAVAVEICKRLHEHKELDDHLMPIGKETVKYAEELDPWKPEPSMIPGRPGSIKRRQAYNKSTPRTFSSSLPFAEKILYIYEIEMKIRVPVPKELNVRMRRLFFPEDTPRCFGIITTKLIPQIPGTPIFTRSGEEQAKLKLCRGFVKLSEQHIKLIRSFHRYVFSDMLRVDRVPLAFNPEKSSSQLFVVVLNKVPPEHFHPNTTILDIDWSFMVKTDVKRRTLDKMKRDPWYNHRMSDRTKIFSFNRELYEDGVVVAKYRSSDQPNRFYVAEIKDELDPSSSFPSNEYRSFKQYYSLKYGLDIKCDQQPLLDVDHTSSRLNLLTPRHLNQKGKSLPLSSLEKKRAKYESLHNRQILIPELCAVHPIPASLWRKAVCLPSILFRVVQLLIAEELRRDIAARSDIVDIIPPLGYEWRDLTFGWDPSMEKHHDDTKTSNSTESDDVFSPNEMSSVDDVSMTVTSQGSPLLNKANYAQTSLKDDDALHVTHSHSYLNGKLPVSGKKMKSDSPVKGGNLPILAARFQSLTVMDTTNLNSSEDESCVYFTAEGNSNPAETHENGVLEDATTKINPESVVSESSTSDRSDSDVSYFSDVYDSYFCNDGENDEEKTIKNKIRRKRKKTKQKDPFWILPRQVLDKLLQENPPNLKRIGPSPGVILRALTLSNASDGFNLERLEMLGDSFLKHAVTVYLYCTYPDAHEGKLSYMRSKKVSNYNLYRIGRAFGLASKMTAHIFDPTVSWMPPGFVVGSTGAISEDSDFDSFSDDDVEIGVWTGIADEKKKKKKNKVLSQTHSSSGFERASTSHVTLEPREEDEIENYEEDEIRMIDGMLGGCIQNLGGNLRNRTYGKKGENGLMGLDLAEVISTHQSMHFTDNAALKQNALACKVRDDVVIDTWAPVDLSGKPLNNTDPLMLDLHNQHSLADKSIADCVEALLGAYLTMCGHRAAQVLLCHFGLLVLPEIVADDGCKKTMERFSYLRPPTTGLMTSQSKSYPKVDQLLLSLSGFESKINYTFKNKSYLLQAFTHASYYYNTVTDCYQRLEFLGDAVLDFLITSNLFNDGREHTPGALTDLRSALVNNTIFASLAVRYDYHKYFKSISPELQRIVEDFVSYQQRQEEAQGVDAQLMHHYGDSSLSSEETPQSYVDGDEEEDTEDVEVPKALGDIFESVAGAIYLDSGMSLQAVWDVYSVMMLPLIEKFIANVPRSPVRELLEMEPETAKFSCAEKRYDGKVRVTVEIIGKGRFKGVGRSYRIAKSAAARRALRVLKGSSP